MPDEALGEVGGLAQLARAPALQAGGRRFDSDILHGESRRRKAESNPEEKKRLLTGRVKQKFIEMAKAQIRDDGI